MEPVQGTYRKATFWERFAAFFIDEIIILIATVALSFFLPRDYPAISALVTFVIPILYGTLFIWKSGSTPGKKILKVKVVTDAYQPVGFGWVLLRETVGKFVSGILWSLGYFWVLIDRRHQAWHDKLARTFVVKTDAAGGLIPSAEDPAVTGGQKVLFGVLFFLFGMPVFLLTVMVFVYMFIASPVEVSGSSMNPTYRDGQFHILNKLAYASLSPERGDVIVYKSPINPDRDYLQRVIAVPGDTVAIQDGMVYLNGQPLDESAYITQGLPTLQGSFIQDGKELSVPEGSYFVLGDNRTHSADSREWGFVPAENIKGKMGPCYYNCSPAAPLR